MLFVFVINAFVVFVFWSKGRVRIDARQHLEVFLVGFIATAWPFCDKAWLSPSNLSRRTDFGAEKIQN